MYLKKVSAPYHPCPYVLLAEVNFSKILNFTHIGDLHKGAAIFLHFC
jgi:hypothetical protein